MSRNSAFVKCLPLGLLCWFCAFAQGQTEPLKRNVLVLNSYHLAYPWTSEVVRGVASVLTTQPFEVELWTEFLDAKRVAAPGAFEAFQSLLIRKYDGIRMDLIVASDDEAAAFLLQHRLAAFGDVPVVFCGVSDEKLLGQLPRTTFTGVRENFDTERLVRFAAGVFPGTELMVVVTDHSANGAGVRKAFGAMARRFEFLDGAEVPFERILERLRQLPPRSVVIASMFTHDNLGAYMPARESSRRIAEASTAPVFSPNTSELGQGYLAGNANGGFQHGEITGQIALRVLKGEAPASIPIASDGPAEPVVDHAAMVRWGLREFDLPAGATVVNRLRGWREFYEANRVLVLGGAGFVALLCGIIVALVLSIIRGREAESALRTSQAQLQRAQKLAHLGSWERALDSGKLVWSPEVYRIHALNPDTFSPDLDKLFGLMHPDDRPRVEEIIRGADSDQRSRTMEYRIIRPDGQVRFVRSHGEWAMGADGRPQIVGTVQDITELKEIEEQFRHVQRVESVGNLAGGIAHDFNNLLTVINGYSQMLAARMTPGSTEHAQLMEIHRAGERGALLTRQLLSFSRKQMMQPTELSLNEVVSSTVGLLRPLLGEAIELKLDLGADLHMVLADRAQLEQAILNLAANARDAIAAEGTLTIETHNQYIDSFQSSHHVDIHPGPYVCLVVSDTGHGMDDATRERIFEPFFTTKEVGKGTGLGLSSVYGMVKQSGGHITVSSRKGEGSVFRLFFPALMTKCPGPVAEGQGAGLILLVDDDAQVREFTSMTLQTNDFRVLACGSGSEALQAVSVLDATPLLLITDVRMPDMGGVELAQKLTERFKSLRVLYISGYATDSREVLGTGQAEHGFLPKPFLPRELLNRVQLLLQHPAQPG